jgi:hypothetical protein
VIEVADKWHEETGVKWDRPCDDPIVSAPDARANPTRCDRCGFDEWDHDTPGELSDKPER